MEKGVKERRVNVKQQIVFRFMLKCVLCNSDERERDNKRNSSQTLPVSIQRQGEQFERSRG